MRIHVGVVAALTVVLGCNLGCKDEARPAPKVDPAAAKAEQDLLARRDALIASRKKLTDDTARLQGEISRQRESGGDTTALEAQLRDLTSQQNANKDEIIENLEGQLATYRAQLSVVGAQSSGAGGELGQVMGKLAQRDAQLATMQDRLGEMSTEMKQLSAALADLGRTGVACAATTAPPTIIQTVDPKAARYGKRDVEPLLSKARAAMSKKGISGADLPGPAQSLEKEATAAMGDADFGKAYFAASQLVATVNQIEVNRGFIGAKIARLSRQLKGKKLAADVQKQVDDLFRDATEKYGDGNFDAANKRLNQIAALI